jgi:uncharacterized membrane protein YphA (DoxX/SURF4 family)
MKNKVQFILCLLFGLMFINAGLNKFFNYIPVPKDLPAELVKVNQAMLEIGWLMPLIATVEMIGGLLFIVKKFRPLAAVMLFPIMVGILLTHLLYEHSSLPLVIVLFVIELWVIIDNREKYLPMIR